RLAAKAGAFGRSRELMCPFLQDARCTIWAHRGTACASFHCNYDRGALGQWLWSLVAVGVNGGDGVVARWVLGHHGLEVAACDALLHAPDDEALDRRAWGAWFGREEAYFLETARRVEALSWTDVATIGGAEMGAFADALRAALA